MNNTLLVIDTINTALNTAIRLNELLQRAQSENRDITDEEIAQIRQENDRLAQELLNL